MNYFICKKDTVNVPKGLTPLSEKALAKTEWRSGDKIYFEGGQTFTAPFVFKNVQDITVGSIGNAPAIIKADNCYGFILEDTCDVQISGIVISGNGWRKNMNSHGIAISRSRRVSLINLDISGFQFAGISWKDGCEDLNILGCFVHDCGVVGITGEYYGARSKNVRIAFCKIYDCAGDPFMYKTHTGSGIVIANTNDGLVEFTEAAGTGWAQRQWQANGPFGMWCWGGCERIIFRYCISRDNRTQPGAVDGGGFDFDGGILDCVMEYNYSYNNEGCGYLMCEFGSGLKWDNNVIKYCVSVNDTLRVPQYGSLHFCGSKHRIISRGVAKDCLLVPVVGRHSISNREMDDVSQGNAVEGCILATDGKRPVESDNLIIKMINNTELTDAGLHKDLISAAPRLFEPRHLVDLPVFKHLESGNAADLLKEQGAEPLFGINKSGKKDERVFIKTILHFHLDGMDLEGSDFTGDVSLHYDSIKPGMSTRFFGPSRITTPVSWEDNGVAYLLRAYARPQSPTVKACLFMTDFEGNTHRTYFNGPVCEYIYTEMEFTGDDRLHRHIGIEVEEGCLLVQSIELIEIDTASAGKKIFSLNDINSWRAFGDIEVNGGFILHGAGSSLVKTIPIDNPSRLTIKCQGKGRLFAENGANSQYCDMDSDTVSEYSIDIKSDSSAYTLGVSRFGEFEGDLIIRSIELKSI